MDIYKFREQIEHARQQRRIVAENAARIALEKRAADATKKNMELKEEVDRKNSEKRLQPYKLDVYSLVRQSIANIIPSLDRSKATKFDAPIFLHPSKKGWVLQNADIGVYHKQYKRNSYYDRDVYGPSVLSGDPIIKYMDGGVFLSTKGQLYNFTDDYRTKVSREFPMSSDQVFDQACKWLQVPASDELNQEHANAWQNKLLSLPFK